MKYVYKGSEVTVIKNNGRSITIKDAKGNVIEALPGDVGFVPDDFFTAAPADK